MNRLCRSISVASAKQVLGAASPLSGGGVVRSSDDVVDTALEYPLIASPLFRDTQRHFHGEMRHWNTDYNHTRIPWDFTLENYAKIDVIMSKFPASRRKSGIIPLLHLAQVQHGGWIPITAMYKIAKVCEVPPMKVFETVTFYAMFNRKPVGKFHIQFCVTTPCMVMGCDELMHACEHYLGIKQDGTTADGYFTLGEMECMGCCVNAPMVVVSDYSNPPNFRYDFYEDLDERSMIALLDALKAGRPTKVGSQDPRRTWSMPVGGRTSIFIKTPPPPYCRDLNKPPPPPPGAKPAAKA